MKAIGFHTPGDPDVLDVIELPDPVPGEGEVLIRVHAAAVNPTDLTGRTRQRRAGTAGGPYVLGMDAAGVIEQIGPETQTDLRVGDRVMAIIVPRGSHGAYAERVAVPAESVAPMPSNTGFAEAATLPMNGLTARLALDRLGLDAGDVVAVTGAAGAMGGYAVQLAKADGLRVVADAAPQDEELVKSLGADLVLPRGEGFAQAVREHYPAGVDALIDGAVQGNEIAAAIKDRGTVITLRGYDQPGERGIMFQPIVVVDYARASEKLHTLGRQAEEGLLSLRVAQELPMDQAPQAHRRLEAGGVRGRLVLVF